MLRAERYVQSARGGSCVDTQEPSGKEWVCSCSEIDEGREAGPSRSQCGLKLKFTIQNTHAAVQTAKREVPGLCSP